MKFKVLTDFKHGHTTFETGNSHLSENYEMADEMVTAYHNAGFISVEGKEDNSLNPSHQEVIADNVTHNTGVKL